MKLASMIPAGNFQKLPLCFFGGQRLRIGDNPLAVVGDCRYVIRLKKFIVFLWIESRL